MSARLRQSGDSSSSISQTSITIKSCAASTFYAKTSRLRSGSNTCAPVVCASMSKVTKQAAGTTTSAASIHYVMALRSSSSSSSSPGRCRCPPMRLACRVIFLRAISSSRSHCRNRRDQPILRPTHRPASRYSRHCHADEAQNTVW